MSWVFLIVAADSLYYVDTLQTPLDTVKPAAVVETADTTKKDTIWTYEVPYIIALEGKSALGKAITAVEAPGSRDYQYTCPEVFSISPFFLLKRQNSVLMTSRACDPLLVRYYFNGHPLHDRFNGAIDLNTVPISCPDSMKIYGNTAGDLVGIDLIGKINRFERPFSILKFTTLGDNTIYNIDFTRALTNEMGFYFSGLYSNIFKSQDGLYHRLNAYSGDFYYNRYLPMRFDLLYASGTYGDEEENSLFDVSLTADIMRNKLCVYYNGFGLSMVDTTGDSAGNGSRNFGLVTETVRRTAYCDLYLGLDGVMYTVETDHEGSFSGREGSVFTGLGKTWRRLILAADHTLTGTADGGIRSAPRVTAGYDVFDSTFLTACISRGCREPAISETEAPFDRTVYEPNPDLETATWWNMELGLKRGGSMLTVYRTDFDDYIVYVRDIDQGYLKPTNRGRRSFSGIEGTADFSPVGFIDLKLAGNYLFSGDPDHYLPSRYAGSSVTLKRETGRSAQSIMAQVQYIGERSDPFDSVYSDAGVVSIIAMIRFITLTAVLKVENILDQDVPYTPVPRLNTSLSLKWEFWD